MINFSELNEVTTINPRNANYDLRYIAKREKWNLSGVAYNEFDINNNGFQLFSDSNGQPVLKVVDNEQATVHAGREGADQKGDTFTARQLTNMLNLEEDAYFQMNSQEHEGSTYITLERVGQTEEDEQESPSITTASDDVEEEDVVDTPSFG